MILEKMHDYYYNDEDNEHEILDLTFIGNLASDEDHQQLICPDCSCSLIEKKDDKHLGLSYNRKICPKCLLIVDQLKEGALDNIKHDEQLHTLTDNNNYSTQPHIEVIHSDDVYELENNDPLYNLEPNELNNLRHHGMVLKDVSSVTKSSVDGRILRHDYNAFET
jgi:Zn-finger nucleic acid-binding protein